MLKKKNNLSNTNSSLPQRNGGGRVLLLSIIVTALFVLGALLVRKCSEDKALLRLQLISNNAIDITPSQVRSIERIGQWEFLAISDEELVDTIRHRTLQRDDRLVRIYHGTLRLGIDLSLTKEGWVFAHGDTVSLTLPSIRLLSNHFIDEARTRSFYESGRWDARAKEQMYHKAARQMRKRALTSQNIRLAEDNARLQMTALFQTFGFKTVEVRFENVP
ncbi:MAG: DUF4230 domain-containing protein [Bacteroidaceae bacterium]|nr:DUF4230 domain-containing protein [Bacteroidaceae bacterium]